jgi:primosomal protein N' (replication factor Y) (superfamily II helicase)
MDKESSIVKVLLLGVPTGVLDYKKPKDGTIFKIGDFVKAPYRNSYKIGIVFDIAKESDVEEIKLKEINQRIDLPALNKNLISFVQKVAEYNITSISSILKMVIPFKNIEKLKIEKDFLYSLSNKERMVSKSKAKEKIYLLFKNNDCKLSLEEIRKESGASSSLIKQLIDSSDLIPHEETATKQQYSIILPGLSEIQKQAVERIILAIENKNNFNTLLLEGVTGSGKTEVYFSAIANILENYTGQVLVLLPEIILTSQFLIRFKERFDFIPAVWHSNTLTSEKKKNWLKIHNGEIRVVVGARSSLFLPFKKLDLIIIDEEHDSSYKQDEGSVTYHARDMAILRGLHEKIPVVLVSATPSIESINNVREKKYDYIYLPNRFGEVQLPEYEIVDLKNQVEKKKKWISLKLRIELINNYKNKKQSLLFINRRGFAPLAMCSKCGYKFICNICELSLVYHKKENKLKCHYCDYQRDLPSICPECNVSDSMVFSGPGVERIEEEVLELLPEAKIALMTRDTVSNSTKAENIINSILSKNIDIIIGTQMIAKGHHFPDLQLVGIIDADFGLMGGDLRASEKMFQLLSQVSGRAGREKERGKVILQTYNKDSELLQHLVNDSKEEFINYEIETRMESRMPPFIKLAAIIVSGTLREKVQSYVCNMVQKAPVYDGIRVLGPIPALLERIGGKYRFRILVKAERKINVQKFLKHWLSQIKKDNQIKIKIDIDPYNFF